MDQHSGVRRPDWRDHAILWGLSALFVALGVRFALVQNVWVDESTQLLGSRLPLGRMMEWLAGRGGTIGVPYDRMPPLSYLIDKACWSTLCASDLHLRLLHLAFATAGVVVLLRLVLTRLGRLPALVAGALVALWPQMTTVSVEIRAYPILFAAAALSLVVFWRLIEGGPLTLRRLLPLFAVLLAAIYTHFFGLVMAGAYCAALLAAKARSRREFLLVVAMGAALLLLSVGLAPFVTGAGAASSVGGAAPSLPARAVTYLSRLAAGPETLLLTPLAVLYFGGLGGLILLALWRLARTPGFGLATPVGGVVVALAAGVGVTLLAAAAVRMFDPLKTTYSIWMWPCIAVLAASACAKADGARVRLGGRACAAALIVAVAGICALFQFHARWFIHGPEQAIVAEIGTPAETAVIYDGSQWAFAFFPLVYRFGTDFPQYVRAEDGGIRRVLTGGGMAPQATGTAELDRYRHLVVAAVELQTYRNLRERLQGAVPSRPALAAPLPGRVAASRREAGGLYSVRVTRFEEDHR